MQEKKLRLCGDDDCEDCGDEEEVEEVAEDKE